MSEIDTQLALMKAERKIIHKKLSSLVYPVLSLPFDVVSEIFVHCLSDPQESEPIFDGLGLGIPLPAPLILSGVCRAWRSIAFQTPRLWASFHVAVGHWSKSNMLLGAQRLTEWVNRAGAAPLSMVLQHYVAFPSSLPHLFPDTFLPILNRSTQWRDIHLDMPFSHLISEQQVQLRLHGKIPNLERLQLSVPSWQMVSDNTTTPVSVFEHAPNLHTVQLLRISPALIVLPWAQLTHFTGEMIPASACLHVLQSAVSLVDCKFIQVSGLLDQPHLLPPHLALKSFTLEGRMITVHRMLDILTLPGLIDLDLNESGRRPSSDEFLSFLSRSRPPLQRLTLRKGYQSLIRGLPLLPSLAALNLTDLSVTEMSGFLDLLRDATFLPNLTSLTVVVRDYNFSSMIDYTDLAGALEYRWTRIDGAPLESFHMDWRLASESKGQDILKPHPSFLIVVPQLLDLMDEGMRISFTAMVGDATRPWL
ncbi:hypothetical protein DFH09DRAFT_1310193 [Mycena vulgaris]|nr:hypothetical protein DFH09DRAFT_1310193 [Mycena vulgaris]